MPLLQRKWSDEQVASAKSMKHTKHVKSSVLFVYVHICLCHTPRIYVCVCVYLCVSALVAAFELCPGPVSKTKANKTCQPVLCVCVCVRVCMSARWCARVSVVALEHVLCKENTATQKKYSHAQHTLSHKHTTHTYTVTHKNAKNNIRLK